MAQKIGYHMWMPLNLNSCNLIHFVEGLQLLRVSENDCQLKLLILEKDCQLKLLILKKDCQLELTMLEKRLPTRVRYLKKWLLTRAQYAKKDCQLQLDIDSKGPRRNISWGLFGQISVNFCPKVPKFHSNVRFEGLYWVLDLVWQKKYF